MSLFRTLPRGPKRPLRKIVERLIAARGTYSSEKVLLECGHEAWCGSNVIYRTRCSKCGQSATNTSA